MLALIILLIAQTMIAPIAVTAEGVAVESESTEVENLNTVEGQEVGDLEDDIEEATESDEGEIDPEAEFEDDEEKVTSEPEDTEEPADETGGENGTEIEEDVEEEEPAPVTYAAEERKLITENIIDEIILKRKDGSLYEDGEQLDPNEDLELGLEWSLPNDPMYVGGDTFTFQLPEQLAIYSEITGGLDEYGTFVVTTDGEVTFTFNDKINENSNVKGTFWVKTKLDKQKITSSTEELEFVFSEDVAKKVTINVKPEGGQAIHKEGQPVDGTFNTEEIQWTVLINTTKDSLKNAIVHDPILEGQELDLDSIELQEIEVNLAGEEVGELGQATPVKNDSTKEELKLELGDTNKAYKLKFKTKMKESEKDREGWLWYSNTAYLNSDGKVQKESGAGVSVQRPESLTKTSSAFDAEDRSVEWTVHANFTEKQLKAGDTITDEFTFTVDGEIKNDVFSVIEGNINVEQVDSFDNNGNPSEKSDAKDLFDISIDGNKVTYTLKEDTSNAFVIKYKTIAEDGAYINKDGKISNKVEIDGKTADSSQGVHQQVGVKTNSGIDYENKTIDWTITVNADKQDLKNFVLTDDFSGSGQQLVEDSIIVDPTIDDSKVTPNNDGEGFKINFGNITETYTITYQTEFTYDFEGEETPNFHNNVKITYDTNDGTDYELEIENGVDPNNKTKNNGVKNGTANNETKEITWTVDVNYNNLTLTDAKVIDEIAGNQSLIEGSVKIYKTTIESGGEIKIVDDVTEQFKEKITTNENLVKIALGEIKKSYRVEFKTKDKDGIYNSDEVYENTAQFIPREGKKHELPASVTLPNQGEFLGKTGLHNKNDWTVDWTIDVNKSKSKLTDVTVTDDLGNDGSQILLKDSFKVTKEDSNEELDKDEYELTIEENTFSIKFPGEITDAYQIKYSSYILAGETADLKNEAEIQSVEEEIVGSVEKEEVVEVKISTGGGTAEGATGGLTLEKTEKDTERPLDGVTFTLIKTVGDQEIVVREGTTNEDGKLEWTGLKYGDYTLKEDIPEGYTGEESQEVTIDNDSLEDGVLTLIDEIVNARQTGTAKIIKTDAVTSEKLPGAAFEITNETTGQKYTLTTENDGTISEEVPYGEYTVEEVTAPNGYKATKDIENITIKIDETTEVTVTNEAIVDVSGQKTWHTSENEENLAAITVELLANGSKVDEQEVAASDEWKYSFTDLDKYDEAGEEIDYSIAEVEVDGYESKTDGYDLTNIQLIDLSGTKIWDELDSQYRPTSITINLLANGREVAFETVKGEVDENEWSFTFSDLPKYGIDGEEIEYTLKEVSHKGYSSEVNHETYEITNTQKTTEVSVGKTWQDDDDATKDRPKSITLQVKNGNTVIEEQEVTTAEDWTYTFTDLPKYDQEGNEIAYTVDEKDVPEGYDKSVDGNKVTNTRTGTTEVEITKHWEDEHETDRPDKITVNLLQNDTFFEEHKVSKEKDWKLNITDLPAFDENGKAYEYSVTEHDVAGYASEVAGFDITNTRADTKDIEITKTWLDTEGTANRPDKIEVELFRSVTDGEQESVKTYEITAADDWKLEIKNVPSFNDKGKAYTYEIAEKSVEGYETDINGFDITNLRVGETEIEGTKTWLDDNSKDRPSSITVELYANGKKVDALKVTDETEWRYAFVDLEAYDNEGVAIAYTIEEVAVNGYQAQINGFDITNLRVGKTNVEGTKTWKDNNADDRPSSIIVELLQNGKKIDEVKVTAAMDWKYSFPSLDKFDENGVAYRYAVQEQEVEGYTSTIEGYNITNTSDTYGVSVDGEETDSEVSQTDGDGDNLPNTATNLYNLTLFGFGLIVVGLILSLFRRRTE